MEFEKDLIFSIAEFIRSEQPDCNIEGDERMTVVGTSSTNAEGVKLFEGDDESSSETEESFELREIMSPEKPRKRVKFLVPESPEIGVGAREELQELMEGREAGLAFIMGHCYVRAKSGSSLIKRVVINLGYDFLRRNSRGPTYALGVPHASTLEVGMIYNV